VRIASRLALRHPITQRVPTQRAVARQLSPTADVEEIGRGLTRLHRLGLVEVWFEGGSSYYRRSR
jgi:hypothetical protein